MLLQCVYWKDRDDVSDIWYLLKLWPFISIERSLELLDYAYPDPAVRGFAIKCLHNLKWVFYDIVENRFLTYL